MHEFSTLYFEDKFAGITTGNDEGYTFKCNNSYLRLSDAMPVSLTLHCIWQTYSKIKTRQHALIPTNEGKLACIAKRFIREKDRRYMLKISVKFHTF